MIEGIKVIFYNEAFWGLVALNTISLYCLIKKTMSKERYKEKIKKPLFNIFLYLVAVVSLVFPILLAVDKFGASIYFVFISPAVVILFSNLYDFIIKAALRGPKFFKNVFIKRKLINANMPKKVNEGKMESLELQTIIKTFYKVKIVALTVTAIYFIIVPSYDNNIYASTLIAIVMGDLFGLNFKFEEIKGKLAGTIEDLLGPFIIMMLYFGSVFFNLGTIMFLFSMFLSFIIIIFINYLCNIIRLCSKI